ncbi:3-methyl-2-oxobutanoate hydroxymethyltransferase [Puniceicoccales bacterium CK1056]|uniref:3-methyl-2-oxobutanoate hydroxymethyltransferase n=1 Tax=Oceanipulchritudo coccoides TaxID=2706888 RepID=A0A6B2M0J2_9BACT|nr:3-methyl-2-oxobutanoate hydroxymethyltransferase [Oceanipulchritudo coccoides]NDV62428.1 3-methyl-2-oxobutanoate hydroxymethyltransferase [Oceanipulchritudo coccoides]
MKSVTDFSRYHSEGQPISMVTCYDAWSARLIAETNVDAVLVGDSVAMVMHGHPSTVHATTDMMASHTAAVRRGIGDRFVTTDIPFPEHRKGLRGAMESVDTIMKAGANAVKIEGAQGHLDVIRHIVQSGVPVMGHLGLTPQSVNLMGGYRVQGREAAAAQQIELDALALQEAGVYALVLECVPAELAARVTESLSIPTIGIGSGPSCSGQILVLQDLLGMNLGFKPKFLRTYAEGSQNIMHALNSYNEDVKAGSFPSLEESFHYETTRKH